MSSGALEGRRDGEIWNTEGVPATNTAEDAVRTSPIDTNEGYRELIDRLNRDWLFGGAAPASGSFKHRTLYRMRRFISRLLGTQEHFNSSVVQFVNTLNEAAGPALGALDDVERHREALAARERRMETEMARMRAAHEELRTAMGVIRQANHDLAREIERLRQGPAVPPPAVEGGTTAASAGAADSQPAARATAPAALVALSHKYVGFEDQFRGTPEAIRERLAPYADLFAGASNVLDIGCGRGEFLALLAERGVSRTPHLAACSPRRWWSISSRATSHSSWISRSRSCGPAR